MPSGVLLTSGRLLRLAQVGNTDDRKDDKRRDEDPKKNAKQGNSSCILFARRHEVHFFLRSRCGAGLLAAGFPYCTKEQDQEPTNDQQVDPGDSVPHWANRRNPNTGYPNGECQHRE